MIDNFFIHYAGNHIFLGASIYPEKAYKSGSFLLFGVTEGQHLKPN